MLAKSKRGADIPIVNCIKKINENYDEAQVEQVSKLNSLRGLESSNLWFLPACKFKRDADAAGSSHYSSRICPNLWFTLESECSTAIAWMLARLGCR